MIDPALIYPETPGPDDEPPEEQARCAYCPLVFYGADAEYLLGEHEVEHVEATS